MNADLANKGGREGYSKSLGQLRKVQQMALRQIVILIFTLLFNSETKVDVALFQFSSDLVFALAEIHQARGVIFVPSETTNAIFPDAKLTA